jgi:hypothetical protein
MEDGMRDKKAEPRTLFGRLAKTYDQSVVGAANQRGKKYGVPGILKSWEWTAVREASNNTCLRCGFVGLLTADHVMPLSLGGSNSIENIQPLCRPCNVTKNATFHDYRTGANVMPVNSKARYYVRVDTYWQNSPDRFVGPFDTRDEAQAAIDDIPTRDNVWLSTSTCGGNIKTAVRVYPTILTATEAKRSGMVEDYASSRYNVIPRMPHDSDDLFEMTQREVY